MQQSSPAHKYINLLVNNRPWIPELPHLEDIHLPKVTFQRISVSVSLGLMQIVGLNDVDTPASHWLRLWNPSSN